MANQLSEELMRNLSLGNSSSNDQASRPSAVVRSRLTRLGVPFKSEVVPVAVAPLSSTVITTNSQSCPPPSVENLVEALINDSSREPALLMLCKVRTSHEDLAPMLWNSKGIVYALLTEIMQTYYFLSTPNLTEKASNRVCNVIALFQTIATHPDTSQQFIDANIHEYLYPFMNTTSQERSHEFLRLTSLGVIGSLVKQDNADIVDILLEGDIVSKLLVCLEVGNQLSKTVAAFILEKLLTIGDKGLAHCCSSAHRFYSIARVLGEKVEEIGAGPSQRLLKHIICCFVKLSENPRACDGLLWSFPMRLKDATLAELLKDDPTALMWLQTLINNVSIGHRARKQPPPALEQLLRYKIKGKAVMGSPMGPWNH